ncbi:MAG: nucleotidyltransferase family protein [Planctomycetota bacterium]
MRVDSEAVLGRVREIVTACLGGYRVRVYLFGSHATGGTHDGSDVDLAVDPGGPLPRGTLSRLREALDQSTIPFRVDVLDLRDADATLRDRVLEEGVEWNVSESG